MLRRTGVFCTAGVLSLAAMARADVVFDESTSGLTFSDAGAGAIYMAGGSPDDGSTANVVAISGASYASATINLEVGKTYRIVASRYVNNNGGFAYTLNLNGTAVYRDNAYALDNPDNSFKTSTFAGYYTATSAATLVAINQSGNSAARVDSLTFTATNDVFFDENTAGVTMTGSAGITPINCSLGGSGYGLGPADTVSGVVNLIAGGVYNVYASRTIHASGNLSYDVTLDGQLLAHDSALPGTTIYANDVAEETLLGSFTSADGTTDVLLSNGGAWAGRVDYLRFELVAVPEPASLLLLTVGGLLALRRKV